MDEKDWYMLKALQEEGSITKASESLYISQPALTKRIKQLENDFNVRIITRSSKGIRFTQEGKYLVTYAKEMITMLQSVKDDLNSMSSNAVSGSLRLGVCLNFAHNHIPRLLKEFSEVYPQVRTHILTGYSSDVIKLIREESIQIAIARGDFSWNGPKKLIKSENICLVSKEKIDANNLPNLPRIDYRTDPVLKKQINEWWNSKYKQPPKFSIEVDNSRTCVQLIEQGLGYAILPKFSLEQNHNYYLEALYDSDGNPLMRDTWIFYQEENAKHVTVKMFVDFIEKQYS